MHSLVEIDSSRPAIENLMPLNCQRVRSCFAVQSRKAVSAYFTSKQILPFGFAEQCYSSYEHVVRSMTRAPLRRTKRQYLLTLQVCNTSKQYTGFHCSEKQCSSRHMPNDRI